MDVVKKIFKGVVTIDKLIRKSDVMNGSLLQERTLRKLLTKAEKTDFGKRYEFSRILKFDDPAKAFQERVPVFDYNSIFNNWWQRTLRGEENVCWPGKVKYFALSSGTSEDTSKRIPVTQDMLHAIRRISYRQFKTFADLELPDNFFQKEVLMVSGSTDLEKVDGHYEGDLSGILTANLPYWLKPFRRPGKKIAREKDWNKKLEAMVLHARDWDIGVIAGVPSWIQILLKKIIDHYQVNNIHEIWPNLKIFIHGGVSFEPYRESFSKLLGKELIYLETYLASEGFLAYQKAVGRNMQLALGGQIFFEFVPFNEENFDEEGQVRENAKILLLEEVEKGIDYAPLITTSAGAWRYLIGDTIRFTSLDDYELIITGRTKHFISLCGEHLSIDNMMQALKKISEKLHINVREFSVAGINLNGTFAHEWYLGTDDEIDSQQVKELLDEELKSLNDDYATEREHVLEDICVHPLPLDLFYEFLERKGRAGGQNKFPRVIKGKFLEEWKAFLKEKGC